MSQGLRSPQLGHRSPGVTSISGQLGFISMQRNSTSILLQLFLLARLLWFGHFPPENSQYHLHFTLPFKSVKLDLLFIYHISKMLIQMQITLLITFSHLQLHQGLQGLQVSPRPPTLMLLV